MITHRGRWLIALAAMGLVIGLLGGDEVVALLSLTVILWVGIEWCWFRYKLLGADLLLDAVRNVNQVSHRKVTLAIDHDYQVQLTARVSDRLSHLRLELQDLVPAGCQVEREGNRLVVDGRRGKRLRWSYMLRTEMTGHVALPGVHVTLSDPQGLLRAQRFVPLRQELTILPFLIRPQTTVSVLKRNDIQLMTGTHRHRRPGFSTELLGIRDYQPGDTPRTIAWKATARLGRLMTCEYESEVPIRATLIADVSPYQFVGRPGPALIDRVHSATASLARLLLADRDPVSCQLVSESERTRVPHGHGERHLTRILQTLLSVATPSRNAVHATLDELTDVTWHSCFRLFPELFDDRINRARMAFSTSGRWTWGMQVRQSRSQRQQLAPILAYLYDVHPANLPRWLHDHDLFGQYCRRFLADYPSIPLGSLGFADLAMLRRAHRRATEHICRALLEATTGANDNELFLVIGHVPREREDLDRFEETIRVARAAHHRVIVVGVGRELAASALTDPAARRVLESTRRDTFESTFHELQRRLGRMGAKLAVLDDPKLIEKVASEIEILRYGRGRA